MTGSRRRASVSAPTMAPLLARDDRLEAGLDGMAGDRPHERALGLDAPHRALVEARVEQRRAVAPALLGGVQGRVRVPQQRLGAGLAVARERDARARPSRRTSRP